jgi:hypothetical protein
MSFFDAEYLRGVLLRQFIPSAEQTEEEILKAKIIRCMVVLLDMEDEKAVSNRQLINLLSKRKKELLDKYNELGMERRSDVR